MVKMTWAKFIDKEGKKSLGMIDLDEYEDFERIVTLEGTGGTWGINRARKKGSPPEVCDV